MKPSTAYNPLPKLAEELNLPGPHIAAVLGLLDEGNTVPFIARYRKEATGSMDEVQIRSIEERRAYLVELETRRSSILESIAEQGKLDDKLKEKIQAATTKSELEDLYLPFKPKRRTRAMIARERGLEPLSEILLSQALFGDPTKEAEAFVDAEKEVPDAEAALAGARDIVAELCSENADIRAMVRTTFMKQGRLHAEVLPGKKESKTKFEQYYDHDEGVADIPSHRYLAIRRGEREEVLRVRVTVDAESLIAKSQDLMGINPKSPFAAQLAMAVDDGYHRLIAPSVETDVRVELKMRSDASAVDVFAANLRNLLMAAPMGTQPVLGMDPGLRTGCKCAAVDATGKYLATKTLFLARSAAKKEEARIELLDLLRTHRPRAVAVGNGTAGRETEAFVRETILAENIKDCMVVQVNEAGASVYSASDTARQEFPELDLTIRGAISIARRLQDPLAELVKIEPKAIGVGQYQHDVHQPMLGRKLDEVVESCVNQVGVELNTASAPLLSRVSGIGPTMAKKIVDHREAHGAFVSRAKLKDVGGLGPRTFQQAAGFLRLREGEHPLDASAVHPERYKLVERMAKDLGVEIAELLGNADLADKIQITDYVSEEVGAPTLQDIVAELTKPGRDPRESYEPPKFRDDVHSIKDLEVGMELEGVVTNVTHFGAFVDVGVHRDGLVHISQLSDHFVKDPQQVVKVGDKLKVRVLEADVERDRVSLSARSPEASQAKREKKKSQQDRQAAPRSNQERSQNNRRTKSTKPNPAKADKSSDADFSHNPFAALLKK